MVAFNRIGTELVHIWSSQASFVQPIGPHVHIHLYIYQGGALAIGFRLWILYCKYVDLLDRAHCGGCGHKDKPRQVQSDPSQQIVEMGK